MARRFNPYPVDRFTLVHLGVGMFLGSQTRLSLGTVTALAVGYEVFERTIKPEIMQTTQDTLANGAIDALATVAGYWVVRRERE